MPARTAEAEWNGNLTEGRGRIKVQSATFESPYDFRGRTADGKGTNPEELIAAAHAGCFSMALSAMLGKAGLNPERIRTKATVHLEKVGDGLGITKIELDTEASIPGTDNATFQKHAENAKANCPVSKVLSGAPISLKARLL